MGTGTAGGGGAGGGAGGADGGAGGIELGRGTGPLRGVRVVEVAGIGPGPHACMLLADLGADVVRLERPGGVLVAGGSTDFLTRGRPSVAIDLKHPEAAGLVLDLVEGADLLVEGMRPGTTERLGIGPDACLARNPRLVYGRMTGWGQAGPLAHTAGHDLNYVALSGALFGLGQDPARPQFPANLLGDFGGGSTYLVVGLLAALLRARTTGEGQVVDAAIVDGTAHLNAMTSSFVAGGGHQEARGVNILEGGAPYYDLYETSDGRHVGVAALEPQFWAELVRLLGPYLSAELPDRDDPTRWPALREQLTEVFGSRPLAEWAALFDGTDACVTPVLTMSEAPAHPHVAAREVFVDHEGHRQPAPAPRFSATPAALGLPPAPGAGAHTRAALAAWGVDDVAGLEQRGVVVQT